MKLAPAELSFWGEFGPAEVPAMTIASNGTPSSNGNVPSPTTPPTLAYSLPPKPPIMPAIKPGRFGPGVMYHWVTVPVAEALQAAGAFTFVDAPAAASTNRSPGVSRTITDAATNPWIPFTKNGIEQSVLALIVTFPSVQLTEVTDPACRTAAPARNSRIYLDIALLPKEAHLFYAQMRFIRAASVATRYDASVFTVSGRPASYAAIAASCCRI